MWGVGFGGGWLIGCGDGLWGLERGFGNRHECPESTNLRLEIPLGQQAVSVYVSINSTDVHQVLKMISFANQSVLSDPQLCRDLGLQGWR